MFILFQAVLTRNRIKKPCKKIVDHIECTVLFLYVNKKNTILKHSLFLTPVLSLHMTAVSVHIDARCHPQSRAKSLSEIPPKNIDTSHERLFTGDSFVLVHMSPAPAASLAKRVCVFQDVPKALRADHLNVRCV